LGFVAGDRTEEIKRGRTERAGGFGGALQTFDRFAFFMASLYSISPKFSTQRLFS
jgi:hypothetical protein